MDEQSGPQVTWREDTDPPMRVLKRDVIARLRGGHTWRGYITGGMTAPSVVRARHVRLFVPTLAALEVECERVRHQLEQGDTFRLAFWQEEEERP